MEPGLKEFIEGMPKTELHMHIEGSFEPDQMFEMAKRNGVTLTRKEGDTRVPYKDANELREAYNFANLGEFLDLYYQGMSALKAKDAKGNYDPKKTEDCFYELTTAYLQKVASQNVTHAEIFFDPQAHTDNGVAFETAFNGIHRALKDAEKPVERGGLGISSKLIMSFLRDKSEEDAFKVLKEAVPYLDKIDGFGLDSYEAPHPPEKFSRVYALLRGDKDKVPEEYKDMLPADYKPKLVAHAGEEGPPAFVWQAINDLKIDRIDHGNRSLEDQALTAELAKREIGLTVCPLSNLRLCGVDDMKNHPLRTMLDKGLMATINSDDPAYFGGYVTENFLAVAEALNLKRQDIITLSRNAIEVSFLSPELKEQKKAELDAYIANNAAKRYSDKTQSTRAAGA